MQILTATLIFSRVIMNTVSLEAFQPISSKTKMGNYIILIILIFNRNAHFEVCDNLRKN